MNIQTVCDLLSARIDSKQLEIHDGRWRQWYGSDKELLQSIRSGKLFRVMRVPRRRYAVELADGELDETFWEDIEHAKLCSASNERIVEFVEVL